VTNFPALDVALGLAFVYFLLSVLASALTETVAWLTKQRSKRLEDWLTKALQDAAKPNQALASFKGSPAYQTLRLSAGGNPSYIPASHFLDGVMHAAAPVAADVDPAVQEAGVAWQTLGKDLQNIRGTPVGDALMTVYRRTNGDAAHFRTCAEAWFDDQMERLSGEYRRWAAWVNGLLGLLLILALNANSIRIAQLLWTDPAVRSAVVAGAGSSGSGATSPQDAITTLQGLPLPLGWGGGWSQSGYHLWTPLLYAIVGGVLTLAAISLGAPFWFDTLSKLARIRTTGSPPPESGATRSGEGDQKRSA
jgi:hypothetical protein